MFFARPMQPKFILKASECWRLSDWLLTRSSPVQLQHKQLFSVFFFCTDWLTTLWLRITVHTSVNITAWGSRCSKMKIPSSPGHSSTCHSTERDDFTRSYFTSFSSLFAVCSSHASRQLRLINGFNRESWACSRTDGCTEPAQAQGWHFKFTYMTAARVQKPNKITRLGFLSGWWRDLKWEPACVCVDVCPSVCVCSWQYSHDISRAGYAGTF